MRLGFGVLGVEQCVGGKQLKSAVRKPSIQLKQAEASTIGALIIRIAFFVGGGGILKCYNFSKEPPKTSF